VAAAPTAHGLVPELAMFSWHSTQEELNLATSLVAFRCSPVS
jgi:hypothetical protein